ncbi:unnamed protein product [Linum trigynum]|uniref:Retrotransposon gag domain-containing protein n=1 Tax=Linum trigynum TaxID=586398 RepID=A0AAV2DZG7_9ROSI
MESQSSLHPQTGSGVRDKEPAPPPSVEELQAQVEQLKAQVQDLTSAPPPTHRLHASYSHQPKTIGGSDYPNGTSIPPTPPQPGVLSYLEAHLTPSFMEDPGHGEPLARSVLDQPNPPPPPPPPNFQMPLHLLEYYGTSNPEDHLSAFQILMPFMGASEATMCKLFPTALRGVAFQWYTQLRNGIFTSFEEFATLFRANFFAHKRPNVDVSHLMSTKQREYENLKEYYSQFSMIVVRVTNLTTENATHALVFGTSNSLLRASLIKRSPRNMMDLQEKVSKYIALDETLQEAAPPKRARSPQKKETRTLSSTSSRLTIVS